MPAQNFSLENATVVVDVKAATNGDGVAITHQITPTGGTAHHLLICGCKDANGKWHEVAKHCPPTHDVVCDCSDPKHPKAFCAKS